MKLRKLEQKDAPLMLEWMHDHSVVENLQAGFEEKTITDCQHFIAAAEDTFHDLHMAIADDGDEYMGTVSLKHIGMGSAEFAITVRTAAMGKGYSLFGMRNILEYGIQELGLQAIYWCVSPKNKRAMRFYDKNGYTRTENVPEHFLQMYDQVLIWYVYR